jgi:prepilin-type N-terminal cleavage/methylation domain-containing protein
MKERFVMLTALMMLKMSRRRSFRRSLAGYTLTELLVAMAITGATAAISLSALNSLLRAETSIAIRSNSEQDFNLALDLIADEVRLASDVVTPATCPVGVASCTPVVEAVIPGAASPIYYYLIPTPGGDSGQQSIVRTGPRFMPDGSYAGGAPASATLLDGLRAGDPVVCPAGSTGTGTTEFFACVNGRNITSLFLRGENGVVVASKVLSRIGL